MAACSADKPAAPTPRSPPNILLILADDLGNNDLGLFGDGSAKTPNIDALAAGGVRFRRHYASATCRPARVELLTGKAATRVAAPPHFRGIGPQHVTLAEALRDAGYATAHVGKWHLGHDLPSARPGAQGFDSWYGFLHALMTRDGTMRTPAAGYENPWLQGSSEPLAQRQGHLTDLLTNAAIEQISQLGAGERPWFINLWYFAPHRPVQPAAGFAAQYPDTPEGRYLALVAQLDAGVGQLMAALEASDQLQNTLVVFLSDNGGLNRVRDSNWPYYGKKNTFYEGGLRTPLILSRPGTLAPRDVQQMVSIRDLMPTLLGFAGVAAVPDLDGVDLRPLLAGDEVARPQQYYWDLRMPDWISWGLLDLAQDRMVHGVQVQQRETGKSYFSPPQQAAAEPAKQLWADYGQWQRRVNRVQAQRKTNADGSYTLSGDDYRRTPGFGAWTLQVPVKLGRPMSMLVSQEQQLQLRLGNGRIDLELPGISVKKKTGEQGCQLLTLSAYYRWPAHHPRQSTVTLEVYVGDREVARAERRIDPDILVDSYPPTLLAADAGEAVISNRNPGDQRLAEYREATGGEISCEP